MYDKVREMYDKVREMYDKVREIYDKVREMYDKVNYWITMYLSTHIYVFLCLSVIWIRVQCM
jgi:predicted proteasome-type protease